MHFSLPLNAFTHIYILLVYFRKMNSSALVNVVFDIRA